MPIGGQTPPFHVWVWVCVWPGVGVGLGVGVKNHLTNTEKEHFEPLDRTKTNQAVSYKSLVPPYVLIIAVNNTIYVCNTVQ